MEYLPQNALSKPFRNLYKRTNLNEMHQTRLVISCLVVLLKWSTLKLHVARHLSVKSHQNLSKCRRFYILLALKPAVCFSSEQFRRMRVNRVQFYISESCSTFR